MSKKSCEAAESAESAILRMARVNCNEHEGCCSVLHRQKRYVRITLAKGKRQKELVYQEG